MLVGHKTRRGDAMFFEKLKSMEKLAEIKRNQEFLNARELSDKMMSAACKDCAFAKSFKKNRMLSCIRFPKWEMVFGNHFCGEFVSNGSKANPAIKAGPKSIPSL